MHVGCARLQCPQAQWAALQAASLVAGLRRHTYAWGGLGHCGLLDRGWPGLGPRPGLLVVMVAAVRDTGRDEALYPWSLSWGDLHKY